jgi:hypothetical protein
MIICLESSILHGYVSNEVPDLITGYLHLAGQAKPLRLELQGNFLRDIAGCRLDFTNPCPESDQETLSQLTLLQKGRSGVMTGSYRVATNPRKRSRNGPLPSQSMLLRESGGLKNMVFLEWFNEQQQRILIQSWHLQVQVSAPSWQMSAEAERQLLKVNRSNRQDFFLNKRKRKTFPPNDPFAVETPRAPDLNQSEVDPFSDSPGMTLADTLTDYVSTLDQQEKAAIPDPVQRTEALAEEMRQLEKLFFHHTGTGTGSALLQLLTRVADLAAHLSHALRQFLATNRENWSFLTVDIENSLPLFSAAWTATEKLLHHQQNDRLDKIWLDQLQTRLHRIEMRMRELLFLLR